ncbi:MAG: ABC transporter ATP-binding protein, partial [Myxococcota bacterium]
RRTFAERREELLAITRLAPFEDRLARALSGGMYKKLALACALLHQPEIVLLDEPTNGVDPVSRRQLWELLYRFIDEGTTVVISSPYMDEAARCHRVVMMNHGLVLDEGAPGGIVARMRAEAFTTEGGERGALLDALDGLPGMLALSPFGDGLRIVVRADAAPEVARAANALGARLVQARAVFEDAFLARLSEGAAA